MHQGQAANNQPLHDKQPVRKVAAILHATLKSTAFTCTSNQYRPQGALGGLQASSQRCFQLLEGCWVVHAKALAAVIALLHGLARVLTAH